MATPKRADWSQELKVVSISNAYISKFKLVPRVSGLAWWLAAGVGNIRDPGNEASSGMG